MLDKSPYGQEISEHWIIVRTTDDPADKERCEVAQYCSSKIIRIICRIVTEVKKGSLKAAFLFCLLSQ